MKVKIKILSFSWKQWRKKISKGMQWTKNLFPQVPLTLNAVRTQGRKQACVRREGKVSVKVGAQKSEVSSWCLKDYNGMWLSLARRTKNSPETCCCRGRNYSHGHRGLVLDSFISTWHKIESSEGGDLNKENASIKWGYREPCRAL